MDVTLSTVRQWWSKRGYQRFYGSRADHDNPYALNAGTVERFETLVADLRAVLQPTTEDRVLDLGGGNGMLARRVFSGCRQLVVSDLCLTALQEAAGADGPTSRVVANMQRPPFRPAAFTMLFSYSTLPHMGSEMVVRRMLDAWDALLVEGGTLFIGDIPDRRRLLAIAARGFQKPLFFDGLKYFAAISMLSYFSRERLRGFLLDKGYDGTVMNQAGTRRFHRERFDLLARKRACRHQR